MMFGLFRRKDPVCGMKEEKGNGVEKEGKWFCSSNCLKAYESGQKGARGHSCCGGHH